MALAQPPGGEGPVISFWSGTVGLEGVVCVCVSRLHVPVALIFCAPRASLCIAPSPL